MKTHDLKAAQISIKRKKKGEYVLAKKQIKGVATEDIMYDELPKILHMLEFPKSMSWPGSDIKFPRPVRWVVALLDRKPLRFKFAGVKADRYSMPNHHFSFKPIRMEKPREYINFLRHGGVVVDPNERRKIILKRLKQAIGKLEGKPLYTEDMIEEINCMTEYPEGVVGAFDEKYLTLPEEVIMTVLKTQGNLIWLKPTNHFVCIFSAKKKALQNVKSGYTNVVSARLYDAHFYYQNDCRKGLEMMLRQTKGMMWLKGLGSLYDKAQRISQAVEIFKSVKELDIDIAKRAAILCKADLLSEMVRERDFTTLQGIAGGYYARASGEDERVARAISEHYLPRFAGDEMPKSITGAVLSITDKVDNIVGAFLSGNRPSGSYDPLGIRRNGFAVVNVLNSFMLHTSLFKIADFLIEFHKKDLPKTEIYGFFTERMTRLLHNRKFRYDEINAVLAIWKGDIPDAFLRCEAMKSFRGKSEFGKLVIGQKRVKNILKDVGKIGKVNPELFKDKTEKKLYDQGVETEKQVRQLLRDRDYPGILNLLLSMRPYIDKFFDNVLVMCEDQALKKNRLALVNYINRLFTLMADFSRIVIEGEKGAR